MLATFMDVGRFERLHQLRLYCVCQRPLQDRYSPATPKHKAIHQLFQSHY